MKIGDSQNPKGQSGITATALFGLCPRCRAKGAWATAGALADNCAGCGLEFARYEPRGRGLYLVVLPITVLLVLAALKLDQVVQLPVWALIALWGLLVPVVVTVALRFAKTAALMARLDKEGLL